MKRFVRALLLALVWNALAFAETARADEEPAPLEILQRAVTVWNARPSPPYVAYTLTFQGTRKKGQFTRELRVVYDATTRTYSAKLIASSGSEPFGVDAERQRLFPDETFGLVPRVREGTPEAVPGGLFQTLATARASARYPYDVSLAGIEAVQGRPAYHLHFVPRADPERYAVRELWADSTTFDVRRIVAYKVEHAHFVSVPFLLSVDYGANGPYWLVERGEAGATAHVMFFTISAQGTATYDNYRFPESPSSGG